ncbi:YMR244C-A [Zygosaccharomyces parabailii]|nr:YMR244C-A [Zygosaccharomyces parabailii]CDH10145.1 related to Cytochrome c oxidase subunit 6B-like protein YMR244C-A [Zygosaccharomyces bailii ISA1307]
MGWFTKETADKLPNNRSQRKQCWGSRDEFFSCLDSIGVVNSLDPTNAKRIASQCSQQENDFEKNCATSWVKYFKEKRLVDHRKEQFLKKAEDENAQMIDFSSTNSSRP